MKVTPFILFAALCLLLVIGRPDSLLTPPSSGPLREERQEEVFMEEDALGEQQTDQIKISLQVMRVDEEPIADIIWLKKAAEAALERGSDYFNILDQSVSRRFVAQEKAQLSVIEGTIQLESDPMTAEYDAHEIYHLVLPDPSL